MSFSQDTILEAAITWQSIDARHVEHCYCGPFASLRGRLPSRLEEALCDVDVGTVCRDRFAAGALVPGFDQGLVRTLPRAQFKTRPRPRLKVAPRLGRFYPLNFLSADEPSLPKDRRPFRIIALDEERLTVDANHPLATIPLAMDVELRPRVPGVAPPCAVAEVATQLTAAGPGMQARLPEVETDFFSDEPFAREDPGADAAFYAKPRLVHHIDAHAQQILGRFYGGFVRSGRRVLDLMSSWASHLPPELSGVQLTGLGLNREELDANPQLRERVVHDLNQDQPLPFADQRFDTVLCTVSVEYLVDPLRVFAEAARVLKPGGAFVVTFSDRWFPTKAIRIWTELHPFERMALVLSYFRRSERFCDLRTETWRGWPRPQDDQYAQQLQHSDPVFAVWGRRMANDASQA